MTSVEWWLLEAVVETFVPLQWIVDQDASLILNCEKPPGITVGRLLEEFEELLTRGDVSLCSMRGERRRGTIADVERELARPPRKPGVDCDRTGYCLTKQGGCRWEAAAKPDWGLYVSCWVSTEDLPRNRDVEDADATLFGLARVTASSRVVAQRYMAFLEQRNLKIDRSSINTSWLCPWRATYWKTLPKGNEHRFYLHEAVSAHVRRYPTWPEWYSQPDGLS